MSVVGIDPGLRRTGLAHVVKGVVVATHTVRAPRRTASDPGAVARAGCQIARAVWWWVTEQAPLEVVAEAFVDLAGRRHHSYRWTTPLVIGAIAAASPLPEASITWQLPDVLGRGEYGPLYSSWKAARRGLIPGDRLITDEHQASAACHALHREAVLRAPHGACRAGQESG